MTEVDPDTVSRKQKIQALIRAAKYRPTLTAGIIVGGVFAALLEGVGLSFILPIVEIAQSPDTTEAEGLMAIFVDIYQFLGVPFTLGFVIAGVSLILTIRWTATFLVRWMRGALVIDYTREIQDRSFEKALDARIEYFDREGSDDILNAIVTQSEYAGRTIRSVINFIEQGLMACLYLAVAFILAPYLTLFALVFLGGFTILFRYIVEPGYDLGDEVAEANEDVQESVQAGTQGIRDTKLFGLKSEIYNDFLKSINQFASSSIRLRRNEQAIKNYYRLLTAVSVFILIYLAVVFADMPIGALGIFLFAMFRLGPKASNMNQHLYYTETNLPHLVRMQEFIDNLENYSEPDIDKKPVPENINYIEANNLSFSYKGEDEMVLSNISFKFNKGDFIGFVGQSGAGKSTIISLLARMYEPDSGEIRANDISIHEMPISEWRSKITVVRQDPFIFNDTLRYNLTIGNRNATDAEVDYVCEIARIDEFFEELPDGYDTELGDSGVRLSGGQKQRVAIARALLKDAEILMLDEATSDLDSNLEKEVQAAIESMNREYAIVGIAHRLSTVKNADCIYTLDSGEIIESGTHDELISNQGQYAELYEVQSKN